MTPAPPTARSISSSTAREHGGRSPGGTPPSVGHVRLDRPLLTAEEAGALLGGILRFTVLQMARDGRLPCLRVGKHVRFCPEELEELLSRRRVI